MRKSERRESFRIPVKSQVTCHDGDSGEIYHGALRDISIIGLFMATTKVLQAGHHCNIDIIIDSNHSRLRIEKVAGTVVRSDSDGMAIKFDERLEWFATVTLCSYKQRSNARISCAA